MMHNIALEKFRVLFANENSFQQFVKAIKREFDDPTGKDAKTLTFGDEILMVGMSPRGMVMSLTQAIIATSFGSKIDRIADDTFLGETEVPE
jgi:hypothetical protein